MGRALSYLDSEALERGLQELTADDERLRRLHRANGTPPLWGRQTGFPTLVKIILEQQVSLDSAAAAYSNLEAAIGPVSPERFLALGDAELKQIGFSRQKTGYCRGIATGLGDGSFDLDGVAHMDDEAAREYLTAVRGIGPWTGDVYLLFALRRPDVWPNGDRALVVAMAENLPLPAPPSYDEAREIADQWRPWRSVAARMLWHAYLLKRGRSLD